MTAAPSLPLVDAIWRALRNGAGPARPCGVASFADRFHDADLAPLHAVEDLVDDLGLRDLVHASDFFGAFGVDTTTGFARPRARARMAVGASYVALADAAALLIRLERFGLAVDPEPLVRTVLPRLAARTIVTRGELDCLWFDRERHRGESVRLDSGAQGAVGSAEVQTAAGYRSEAWLAADGRASQVWVRSPRHRRRSAA